MIKDAIAKLVEKDDLTKTEAHGTMKEIMTGAATPSQIAGFLVSLRNKGETVDEIAGCALAMREAATPVVTKQSFIVDCCGTGGDRKGSLNISTAAAFVAAGAGLAVAKHGNRSVSSQCGSADVLQTMGVRIDGPPALAEKSLDEAGIAFLFAPAFHPAMRHAMPTRKELGIRTVFNILGPLTNPVRADVQLIGVFNKSLLRSLADVMNRMGNAGGLVVHSAGWDEVTLGGPTDVAELLHRKVRTYKLSPKDFGLPKTAPGHLKGGDARRNADLIREILSGKKHPARNTIIANAAALIWIAERTNKAKAFPLKEAVRAALASLDSGAALNKLNLLAEISHSSD